THENVPGSHTVGPNAAGVLASTVVTIVTLNIIKIDPGYSHEEYPSDSELKAAAPIAYAAATALHDYCDRQGKAARCTYHFLLPPPSSARVQLKAEVTMSASTSSAPCTLARSYTFDLGRADAPKVVDGFVEL